MSERYYAYRHKRDPERFGVLLAVSYSDARRWLGSAFDLRMVRQAGHSLDLLDRETKRRTVNDTLGPPP